MYNGCCCLSTGSNDESKVNMITVFNMFMLGLGLFMEKPTPEDKITFYS
jgi:hypothetical protein